MNKVVRYVMIIILNYQIVSSFIMVLGQSLTFIRNKHAFIITTLLISFPLSVDIYLYTQDIGLFKITLTMLIIQLLLTLMIKHKYR